MRKGIRGHQEHIDLKGKELYQRSNVQDVKQSMKMFSR